MTDDINAQLLVEVRKLTQRIESLETDIKSIKLLNAQNVPEETIVAIAAAVAAYLGHRGKRRQAHFSRSSTWQASARRNQHVHSPLHLR